MFAAGATGNNGLAAAPVSTSAEIEIRGNGTGGAFAAFNRPGAFTALLGPDVDNVWKVGGGSAGLGANPLWHAGNDGSGFALDGFLAHDLTEVKPDAMTREKDAMRLQTIVDRPAIPATYNAAGKMLTPEVPEVSHNERVPDYQSVDLSKLVPLLTASVQRLADEVDLLKAQLQGANDNG